MMTIGLVLVIISLFLIRKDEKNRENFNLKIDEAFESINNSLDDFYIQTDEFNSTCELIFTEIDGKYQELLYLYNLIEEQNALINDKNTLEKNNHLYELDNEIRILGTQNKKIVEKLQPKKENTKKQFNNNFIYSNKKAIEIFRLYDQGMSTIDIAKHLSIGQGEVKLMLNIRKV